MEAANRPRWRGQAGFFEIWFLVVIVPGTGRAWWLRWTTFAPAGGGPARATLWAAAFDAHGDEPAVAVKAIRPIAAWTAARGEAFHLRLGDAVLDAGGCRGAVAAGGHAIAWDLRFAGGRRAVARAPALVRRLPLPTQAAHASPDLACSGWIEVDGRRDTLAGAPAVQKHLWGTHRVEELVWLWCPQFDDAATTALEATAVRVRQRGPAGIALPFLSPVWARSPAGELDLSGLPWAATTRLERPAPFEVVIHAAGVTRGLRARARCEPRACAGYVYRDPAGTDLHVAQSDVAACTLDLLARPHPLAAWRTLACAHSATGAALELHGPAPLPGVRYLAWDAEHA